MKKIKSKSNLIIFILFVAAFLFMSIGFASYNQLLDLNGTVVVQPDGKIYLKSVRLTSSSSATASPEINTSDGSINFNLRFQTKKNQEDGYEAVFTIVIANESSYDYVYSVPNYRPTASKNGTDYSNYVDYIIDGITPGHVIPAKSEKTFTVTFSFINPENSAGTYIIGGDFIPDFTEDENATLRGVVDETQQVDLTGSNTLALVEITVMNTYNVPKTFTIVTDNDKFETRNLTDTGIPQYTIDANTTSQTFQFYMRIVGGSDFVSSSERARILIVPSGESEISAGRITVLVDRTIDNFTDTTPPTISNVTAVIQNSVGTVLLTWEGEDDSGEAVQNYTIVCFNNSNGSEVSRKTTSSDVETYTYTGLSAGTYYFTVFGTDQTGNSASSSQITSATTSPGYACRSTESYYRWKFNVTNKSNNNVTYSGATGNDVVNRGDTYTATVRSANTDNYYQPASSGLTIKMGGETITNYTYNSDTGLITIPDVTGDLEITATVSEKGFCLAKGTKILLANGEYKNIENIKYTDLLKVYNHVTGELTEVYPIWMEKDGVSNKYRKITFSDGSYLKIINNHSIFDVDKKRYIDASNDDECKIGNRVYKVKNDKLEVVTITNIEDVKERVEFYNVVSTKYYNIIANDILTTDTTSSISNVYGFKENAIYGEAYYYISKFTKLEQNEISYIPNYLFKGLNLENTKLLLNNSLDIGFLSSFVEKHTERPITKNGNMYFMVTTSLDNINSNNPEKYLYKEGSFYKLPEDKAKYFIETSTGKIYNPGETIKVENSVHFKAVD